MQYRSWFGSLFLLFNIFSVTISDSYYTVIAPGTIKSNRKYSVCVTLHDALEPSVVRVSLVGEPLFNFSENVELRPFESKFVDFLPPKLAPSFQYKLQIESVKGKDFRNSTALGVEDDDKSLKVYIQTDKGFYKPGDEVQFRIVVLDEHLKPFKSVEPIQVEVSDGHDNRIKQFKDVSLNTGVFTSNFHLSEQPAMGTWHIMASVGGKYNVTSLKEFQVMKFVLPKFAVFLDTQTDYVLQDHSFTVGVYGKYSYGKYVEGTAKVELLHPYTNKTIFMKTTPLKNYRASVTFEFDSEKNLEDHLWISILATIEEAQTGITQATLQHLNIRKEKYDIIVPEDQIEFRNNKPYKMKVMVQHWNGTRIYDRKTPITLLHGNRTYEALQDERGVATFTIDHTSNNHNVFKYRGSSKIFPNIYLSDNSEIGESLTHCTLELKGESLRLGSTIEVELSSEYPIPYIVYTITSHAAIVRMDLIKLNANQKSHIIKINPAIDMVPRSYLYVHYIVNGNLRYCELKLIFPHEFENKVSVIAPQSAKPGQEIRLNVMAEPHSCVGLLAVDLRVHFMDSGYNLDIDRIFRELITDQTYSGKAHNYPGQESGLITLTNAHYMYMPTAPPRKLLETDDDEQGLDGRWADQDSLQVRSKFPETWIFQDLNITKENTQLTLNIPDTITTWLVTAFSVNDKTGFGMMNLPTNITVFKTLFISTNLPYSIKRGEIVQIPLTVFNYHHQDMQTQITMNNADGDFDFMDQQNKPLCQTQVRRQVNVPSNSGKSVQFSIKPKKLGFINIRLTATNELFKDAVLQQLRVEAEGTIERHSKDIFINLPSQGQNMQSSLDVVIPPKIVPDSEFIQLAIGSDILSSTIDNLNSLVILPTGCGEQNMVNFAPNVLVLDYLKAVSKTSQNADLVQRALRFIETGYQQELTYRHDNGAYSVFGPEANTEESTWLTAYVIRFFIKAQRYASVETRIIHSGLRYLADKQLESGEFPYTGYLFHPAHQDRYGFTAFVLMAFLESSKYGKKYKTAVRKGVNFLESNVNNANDTYALSLMAVALQMSKSEHINDVLGKLQTKAKEEKGFKWWPSSVTGQSNEVEITAYVLMALIGQSTGNYIPIVKWILAQRNKAGGFKSTHDTVVGLQALTTFSEKYPNTNETMFKVEYKATDSQGKEVKKNFFGIDPSNMHIWQQHELPLSTRSVQFKVEGRGSALLQLSYHYYIPLYTEASADPQNVTLHRRVSGETGTRNLKDKELQSFKITPMAKMSTPTIMEMEICFKFEPSEILKYRQTNMVIMEVSMLSGFTVTSDALENLTDEEFIARVQLKNSDTTAFIYFKHLQVDEDDKCINLKANKIHEVEMLQPSTIVMYDYYNSMYRDTVSYTIKK